VNLASLAGQRGSINHTPYATAKGGVLALTRSLAQELSPYTRVNAVSPGLIDTRMMKSLDDAKRQNMIDSTPLQRLGRPEEVASVVDFLCSDAATFITGETIQVNGGLYIN
jgi:3-oxoacyl-[acyl-carrier protein] reductase